MAASWLFHEVSRCPKERSYLPTGIGRFFVPWLRSQEGFAALEEAAALSGMKPACGIPCLQGSESLTVQMDFKGGR